MVLGLTMAEISLLIAFVLLLSLGALLSHESTRRENAEEKNKRFAMIQKILEEDRELPKDPQQIAIYLRKRVDEHRDADNWRTLVRELKPGLHESSPGKIVAAVRERFESHTELEEALKDAGSEPSPGVLRYLAGIVAEADRQGITLQEAQEAMATWSSDGARGELVDAQDRIERLENRLKSLGGGGTDHPSCWYADDSRLSYLLDVVLHPAGLFVDWAEGAETRSAGDRRLPVDDIRTLRLRPLSREDFLEQTRSVFEWSREAECRFFVRIYDTIDSTEKDTYKSQLRTVEMHFYKYEVPLGRKLPPALFESIFAE